MAEIRRGTAMVLITAGDRDIAAAGLDGILRGKGCGSHPPALRAAAFRDGGRLLEAAKPLTHEQAEIVSAEIDRQSIADMLREEMHPEPVDYAGLMFDAEMSYGESVYGKGAARRALDMLLVGWALVALGFERLFESVNGGR